LRQGFEEQFVDESGKIRRRACGNRMVMSKTFAPSTMLENGWPPTALHNRQATVLHEAYVPAAMAARPALLADNVACLDCSVVATAHGDVRVLRGRLHANWSTQPVSNGILIVMNIV
jgi:hypothetical protein